MIKVYWTRLLKLVFAECDGWRQQEEEQDTSKHVETISEQSCWSLISTRPAGSWLAAGSRARRRSLPARLHPARAGTMSSAAWHNFGAPAAQLRWLTPGSALREYTAPPA